MNRVRQTDLGTPAPKTDESGLYRKPGSPELDKSSAHEADTHPLGARAGLGHRFVENQGKHGSSENGLIEGRSPASERARYEPATLVRQGLRRKFFIQPFLTNELAN